MNPRSTPKKLICMALILAGLMLTGNANVFASDVENALKFTDVPDDAWYAEAVRFCEEQGIVDGVKEDVFDPNGIAKRAQIVKVICKAYGIDEDFSCDNFIDAYGPDSEILWYTGFLGAAKERNIVEGIGENEFDPDGDVTRAQMFTMLYRELKELRLLPVGDGSDFYSFPDRNDVPDWALEATEYFVRNGIVKGNNGKLLPGDTCTRAEMVQLLFEVLNCTSIAVRFEVVGRTGYFHEGYGNGIQLARSREDLVNILSAIDEDRWWSPKPGLLDEKYNDAYFAEHYIITFPFLAPFTIDQVMLEGDQLVVYETITAPAPPINAEMLALIEVDNTHLGNVQSLELHTEFGWHD